MTIDTLIDRVLSKMPEPTAIAGPELEGIVPTALARFAESVAFDQRASLSELLNKNFEVVITDGIGSLSDHLTAAEPLLINAIKMADVKTPEGKRLQYVPDRTLLELQRSRMFIYFTLDGVFIRTVNTDGSQTSLTTTLTVGASYVPTLANVPKQLEDEFIDVVIDCIAK